MLYSIVPYTTGAAAIATIGTCVSADIRNTKDWKNDFIGGALAGAFVNGIKRNSLQAAFVGSLVIGFAAASPAIFASVEGGAFSPRPVDARSMVVTPQSYAVSASASSNLHSRLQ